MPRRDDIDVLHLMPLLGWMSFVEIRAYSPRFVYRVVGTRLEYRQDSPRDARPLDEVRPEQHREVLRRQYEEVAGSGQPLLVENTVTSGERRLVYRRLSLPLGDDGCKPNMLLLAYDLAVRELHEFFESHEHEHDARGA